MSTRSVTMLLNKIEKELASKPAAKRIRKHMNKQKVHSFSMSIADNISQIAQELQAKQYPIDETVVTIIEDISKDISEETYRKAVTELKAGSVTGSPVSFVIKITESVGGYRQVDKKTTFVSLDYFNSLKEFYKNAVARGITKLNKHYKTLDKKYKKINRKNTDFLDLGHREGSEIATEQVRIANENLYKALTNKKTLAGQLTPNDLKILGLELSIIKKDSEERDIVEVSLESSAVNRDTREEKAIKAEFLKVVRQALVNLKDNLQEFEGSDSRVTKLKKQVIKNFASGIKKDKRVTVKTTSTKIKKSSNKKQSKRLTPASAIRGSQVSASLSLGKLKPHKVKETKPAGLNYLSLQVLLNAKLPDAVRRNMGPPGLTNTSGRFASSTKVTDIIDTKKGFASIGYTYDKNPYQIFEPGAGRTPWATSDRDPRKVIDRSLREIASEYLAGRFYTRRV